MIIHTSWLAVVRQNTQQAKVRILLTNYKHMWHGRGANGLYIFYTRSTAGPCRIFNQNQNQIKRADRWRDGTTNGETNKQMRAEIEDAGWLVGWLGGWLGGWVVGWLGDWLVGWLVGWVVGWVVGWLGGWWVGGLGCWYEYPTNYIPFS